MGETPHCVWEYDLPLRNRRFLASLDPGYFGYLAAQHVEHLESEHSALAAVALRAGYHHGLETLFSLLGVLAQAPGCVPAWLPRCSHSQLRDLVIAIGKGEHILTEQGRQTVTFSLLSSVVHQFAWPDEDPPGTTAQRFAALWERFASDFTSELGTAEYNSIKHGMRVASGGFVLRIGLEHEYGVPPADAEMETVGASPYGTTFYLPEPVPSQGIPGNRSFRIRRVSLNWRAEAMAQRLQLIEFSVGNTIGALQCMNGADPTTVRFSRPADPAAFEQPWQWEVGVESSDLDMLIEPEDVSPTVAADLLQELEAGNGDSAA